MITFQAKETVTKADVQFQGSSFATWQIANAHSRLHARLGADMIAHMMRTGALSAHIDIAHYRSEDPETSAIEIGYEAAMDPEYPEAYHEGYEVGSSYAVEGPRNIHSRKLTGGEWQNPYPSHEETHRHWAAGYYDGLRDKKVSEIMEATQ